MTAPDVNKLGLLDCTGPGLVTGNCGGQYPGFPITKTGQKEKLVALGKALFWDMQVGSDGVQACASRHFHAGADNRIVNQKNPGLNRVAGTHLQIKNAINPPPQPPLSHSHPRVVLGRLSGYDSHPWNQRRPDPETMGISSDTTARHMLHRLRKGMVNENRSRLSALIEADESIIGGPAKGKKGRGVTAAEHKTLVIGAVEILTYEDKKGKRCERAGRLPLSTLDDAGEVSIRHFLTEHIEARSILRTDGWRGYSGDALVGYRHRVRVIRTPKRAHWVAPHIHRVFSNLKTWINGTHHGVEPKYLQSYLDEFVFRFTRRNPPMAAFQTLLGISTRKAPLPLRDLAVLNQP